jgi:DNA (cytosine-5)-methyltransferase 1
VTLRAIDLFSGAGGLSLGLATAGFDVVAAVDNWQLAVDTYTKNHSHAAISRDVSQLSGAEICEMAGLGQGHVDLLAGGPPCQGFSVQRIGGDYDARNALVLEFARLVAEIQPRAFLMENVPGLLGKRGAHTFSVFQDHLSAAGYVVDVHRVNAADYGVPQNRRRVLVSGFRGTKTKIELRPEKVDTPLNVWDAIGDLPPASPPGEIATDDPLHAESRMSPLNRERLALIPPGGGFEDLPVDMRVACHARGAAAIGHRGVYGRLHPAQPAGTITARFDSFTRGRFAHPYANRNITLREGARLQTFPDDFVFLGNREEIAAQIGNAVAPRLAARFAFAIKQQLDALP